MFKYKLRFNERSFILRAAERKCEHIGDLQWVKICYKIELMGVYYNLKNHQNIA